MTYAEAHAAMTLCLSFGRLTSDFVKHWNAIEDALMALPFEDFYQIALEAECDPTEEACALICICD